MGRPSLYLPFLLLLCLCAAPSGARLLQQAATSGSTAGASSGTNGAQASDTTQGQATGPGAQSNAQAAGQAAGGGSAPAAAASTPAADAVAGNLTQPAVLNGNLAGGLQGCTDIAPPGSLTCAQHKAQGNCNSAATTSRNFCAASCGRCQPADGAAPTAANPAPQEAASAAATAAVPAPSADSASPSPAPAPEPEAAAAAPEPESSAAAVPSAAAAPASEHPATARASASANATAVPGEGEVFSGDGTAYSEPVDSGKGFACSYRYLNDWAKYHFAAVNLPQWDNGNSCGRCATVRCIDDRCPTKNKDVTVMIVDQCPECKHGDLDFSIPVYRDITGSWPNRLTVQWQWADCGPFMTGDIMISPKDGTNAWFQAFYVSNAKYPIKSVSLDGKVLERSQYQFFQNHGSLGAAPHKLTFEADNGKTVTATVDDILKEQKLGVQFP